jgi:hypothetical protein
LDFRIPRAHALEAASAEATSPTRRNLRLGRGVPPLDEIYDLGVSSSGCRPCG